jgi:hypothetical protein
VTGTEQFGTELRTFGALALQAVDNSHQVVADFRSHKRVLLILRVVKHQVSDETRT